MMKYYCQNCAFESSLSGRAGDHRLTTGHHVVIWDESEPTGGNQKPSANVPQSGVGPQRVFSHYGCSYCKLKRMASLLTEDACPACGKGVMIAHFVEVSRPPPEPKENHAGDCIKYGMAAFADAAKNAGVAAEKVAMTFKHIILPPPKIGGGATGPPPPPEPKSLVEVMDLLERGIISRKAATALFKQITRETAAAKTARAAHPLDLPSHQKLRKLRVEE